MLFKVNAATRTTHHLLNKLIITRLPLALPPYAFNPSLYASGLLHIAPVYITFEALWTQILDISQISVQSSGTMNHNPSNAEQLSQDSQYVPNFANNSLPKAACAPKVCTRMESILRRLQLTELLRSGSLRADIRNMTSVSDNEIQQLIETVSATGFLSKFLDHIRSGVAKNPHIILAYAWVLYMALFSGGRYIRASLEQAGGSGASFWARDSSLISPYSTTEGTRSQEEPKLSALGFGHKPQSEDDISKMNLSLQFFHFVGETDGEDIKAEFKKRFIESEKLLTSSEKIDIVLEAQYIFKFMTGIVLDLDDIFGTQEDDLKTGNHVRESSLLMSTRDSISIAKKRLCQRHTVKNKEEQGSSIMPSLSEKAKPMARVISFETPTFSNLRNITTKLEKQFSKEQLEHNTTRYVPAGIESRDCYQLYTTLPFIGAFVFFLAWWYWLGHKPQFLE